MPKYYCDYCRTHLTHDSPSVRRSHNIGTKHRRSVRDYYAQFELSGTQHMIDHVLRHGPNGGAMPFPGGLPFPIPQALPGQNNFIPPPPAFGEPLKKLPLVNLDVPPSVPGVVTHEKKTEAKGIHLQEKANEREKSVQEADTGNAQLSKSDT